ncbi:MAG: formyltetrahydrofolate deformylase, partial [Pseudomonadota bacterium]
MSLTRWANPMIDRTNAPILTLSCPDARGIVATVSSYLAEAGCNILQSAQFDDLESGLFFMRVQFDLGGNASLGELTAGFSPIARRLSLDWQLHDMSAPMRILVMASKADHCLTDLLHRQKRGEIHADICGVISNHPDVDAIAKFYGVPFFHMPVNAETKRDQEAKVRR